MCTVCGGGPFRDHPVLWDALAEEWQLSAEERAYIDRQQGTLCGVCGANLRSVALADAIRAWAGTALTLNAFVRQPPAARLAVLEVNEAGMLSPALRQLPHHVLAAYPAVDIQALPYADGSFDLVVHSDTLEHVPQPLLALQECHRVLRPGGALCYTVPTLVGRMTRSRAGLPASYHGGPGTRAGDLVVHTEFGADAWTWPLRAGFSAVTVHAVDYPSALALAARREGELHRRDGLLQQGGQGTTHWRAFPLQAVAAAMRRLTGSAGT